MVSKIISIGLKGVKGYRVQVEVQTIDGIDALIIRQENRHRFSTALSLGGLDKKV